MQSQIAHPRWCAFRGSESKILCCAFPAHLKEVSRAGVHDLRVPDKGLQFANHLRLHFVSNRINAIYMHMAAHTMPHIRGQAAAERPQNGSSFKSKIQDGDAILIVDHGSRRPQSNALLNEFVKMYKEETGHRVVEAAHMELATPTIADAFDRCVEQGATRIIISPYFLSPGRHWDKDIPALAAEASRKHSGVSYLVAAPIGLHKLMVTILQDRMEYCLSQAAGDVPECDMCEGSGRCKEVSTEGSQNKPNASISTV